MDYKQKIKGAKDRLNALTTRMDEDVFLLREKYIMRDKDKNPLPDIVNVTLNKVSLFAAFSTSELSKATQQVVVESDSKSLDTTYIEEFQEAAFASANDRLRRMGKPQLNPFFDVQNCFRGRCAARCLFRMEGDILIPDITPWDARYVTYEMGEDGLDWACYETERSKSDIEAEYGIVIVGKKGFVWDIWDRDHNEIWIDMKKVEEQPHSFGFTPIALQIVSLGYGAMLLDADSSKYDGESIFFLIRDLVPELNRVISISQTLNFKAIKPPMTAKLKGKGEAPEYDVTNSGTMSRIEPDEKIEPIEYGDIKATFDRAYSILEKAIQEGSLTNVDIGDPRQPFSAVALVEIGESRGQVLLPRLAAKSLMNKSLAEMFTRQVIQIGGSVELGVPGHKRSFETSKLDGEYSTEYKYFIKSPKEDIARYSIAAAAGDLISNKTKRETILQLEDPEGEKQQLDIEDAERLSPMVKMNRVIRALIDEDTEESLLDAEILSAEMGVSLKQMIAGEVPKPEERDLPTQAQLAMPELGVGDELTSATRAAGLKATPRGGI